ncbi:hypothetical protein HDK64DRAFT_253423 [Phyllosticta capitalensis]
MDRYPYSQIRESPLPPLPAIDPLSPQQWQTLLAVADAIIPSIEPIANVDKESQLGQFTALTRVRQLAGPSVSPQLPAEFLAECPSYTPGFRQNIQRVLADYMPADQRRLLVFVLTSLETRAGALLLTGYAAPFTTQPPRIREAIIKSWATARISQFRMLHTLVTMLVRQNWIMTSPTLPQVLGFPRIPTNFKLGRDFEYEFIQFPPGTGADIIETDVVVVGSGCGAGVCAKNLAEAGQRVIVAEKSYYWPPEHLPMTETEGWGHLYMNGGMIISDESSMTVVAGQSFGGGGVVNWSASLQTQGYVREEWAAQGLPLFTSAEFQDCLDRVCDRMGVSSEYIRHNPTNQALLEGARRLGWAHRAVPQNTAGAEHYCGVCSLGCSACEKQGPAVSFLPDAAKAGANFVEGFEVKEVLFQTKKDKRIATGVRGVWTSRDERGGVSGYKRRVREVIIRAKRIVVSGGSMQSPLLLMRSGIKNPNVGRNLHLHPVAFAGAVYREKVNPWEGGILTAVVNEFENLDGQGHGAKLEAVNMLPSIWLTFPPTTSGLDYKMFVPNMKHMVGYISLARDRDTGRVYPDPVDGRCRLSYAVSKYDQRHMLEGIIGLAKTQYAAGALEIVAMIPGVPRFKRTELETDNDTEGINDKKFQDWLKMVRKKGFPSPEMMFLSAHQMGTCRMGSSPSKSVVDQNGQVWGTEGLYVADASVFPSASGVNPMVTIMGKWISPFVSNVESIVAGCHSVRAKFFVLR